jgi:hypothetical protein
MTHDEIADEPACIACSTSASGNLGRLCWVGIVHGT